MTTTPTEHHESQTIKVATEGRVATITIDRPHALNALNTRVLRELVAAAEVLDRDPGIGAILITGSARAFAAGADIKEMADQTFVEMFLADYFAAWQRFAAVKTPTVAGVAGYALGGGCELAMMCDVIIAADNAMFGQPEIKLGVIPGMGGSQRLTRAIGKAKAMEMILTGRTMKAAEAEAAGLVSRVVPADKMITAAKQTAATIAAMSLPAAVAAKEAVSRAYETTLNEGVIFERRLFHSMFATQGQHEGMAAFIEKRDAEFNPS